MPVIIRRPHAYQFLLERFEDGSGRSGDVSGGEAGLRAGGVELPIPGMYVLDGAGRVLGKVALQSPGARSELLALLREHRSP